MTESHTMILEGRAVSIGDTFYTVSHEHKLISAKCVWMSTKRLRFSGDVTRIQAARFECSNKEVITVYLYAGDTAINTFMHLRTMYYRNKSAAIEEGLHKLRMRRNFIQSGINSKAESVRFEQERRFKQRLWRQMRESQELLNGVNELIDALSSQAIQSS